MTDELVTLVRHQGRRMRASVKWWLEHGVQPAQLRCMHNVPLDRACEECEEQA